MGKLILDLCGGTGAWSKPYKDAGYDVRVITLPEHDVKLFIPPDNVYGVLAAPPCTEFSKAKHFHGKGNYEYDFAGGLAIADACVRIIWVCNPNFYAIENPSGYLKRWYKHPTWTFQPYYYGDKYQKTTCLWGKFNIPTPQQVHRTDLPKFSMLKSKDIHPEHYGKLTRQVRRSITPPGFSNAFFKANQ